MSVIVGGVINRWELVRKHDIPALTRLCCLPGHMSAGMLTQSRERDGYIRYGLHLAKCSKCCDFNLSRTVTALYQRFPRDFC